MKNYVVVAIDAALRDHLVQRGINVYFKDIQVGAICRALCMSLLASCCGDITVTQVCYVSA